MTASVIPGDSAERCYICGRSDRALHVHHMLHGSYRHIADKYGLTVHLCYVCHNALHDRGEHDADMEELAQIEFYKHYGRDEWIKAVGTKNYIR